MKVSDFIHGVGRPVAYYPRLTKITGSVTATIFLCQLMYWEGKQTDPDGWINKGVDEMEGETGLTYEEQRGARAKLKKSGFIEERYARLDHKLFFKVNSDVLNDAFYAMFPDGHLGISQMGNEEFPRSGNRISPDGEMGNPQMDYKEHRLHTEITTEITTEKKEKRKKKGANAPLAPLDISLSKKPTFDFREALRSHNVNPQALEDWLDVRKKKKASNTETAYNGFMREVERSGLSVHDVVVICAERGWQGFNADWVEVKPKPWDRPREKQDFSWMKNQFEWMKTQTGETERGHG